MNQISTIEEIDGLFAQSFERPVVFFKHSTRCPVSSNAFRQMSAYGKEVEIIYVVEHRAVSNFLAEKTGVRHESPQVLVVFGGKVVWNASHYDISALVVRQAVTSVPIP